jgi:hypothetical protein
VQQIKDFAPLARPKRMTKGLEGNDMIKNKVLGHSILLALSVLLIAAGGSAQQAQQQAQGEEAAPNGGFEIESKATEVLKASSSRLAAARSMKFTAVVSYENPSRPGPPLVYTTKSEITLQRPDKLRVITPYDGPATEFYYDGKTMTAFSPAEDLVAVAEAPPTLDEALEAAYHSAAIYFPFSDVIVADPYKDIEDGLTLAFYIGQSRVVGGTTTDMVAYETHGTFVQVWIGAEDKLPRMARAVFANDPSQLRHQVAFFDWQLNVDLPDGTFSSPGAAKAKPIPFARPDATLPPGERPPGETAPPKTEKGGPGRHE